MFYFFKRKYRQIRNVLRWLPIIWDQFDFDHGYAIEVFKFQLTKIANFLESDKAITLNAKQRAQRLRMVLRLMDKVYNEEYAIAYFDEIKKLYGKSNIKFVPTGETTINPFSKKKDKEEKLFKMVTVWEKNYTKKELEEIKKVKDKLFHESHEKQKRAHKLLWELIEHNINSWWD